ncbi:DUF305 domain-containing protein [Micromonospora hortensis]|uniref:DUF305 domain-containing protein n=1 Tax=Micromonospora hortensis TaxID=2911209 RepID=UPI001EE905A0|nr:DUF305 domain-containing protein [Micromonospora hortensis]MCG5449281.1 DUF305 domain-containing protein [Micromonospora hortensis]
MRQPTASTVLIAVLLVAGCGGGPRDATGTATPPVTAPPATTAPTPTGTAFNPTDIAWLQLTVAMTERLLPVLDLVPARTTDPAWRQTATQVATTRRADLDRARRLLADAAAPTTNPHEGHDMPGMATAQEMTALRAASGQPFHHLLAGHLRAHLAQSVRIATAEQQSGVQPATVALAAAVVRSGTADLERLDRLDARQQRALSRER